MNSAEAIVKESRLPALFKVRVRQRGRCDVAVRSAALQLDEQSPLLTSELRGRVAERHELLHARFRVRR